MTHPAVLTNDTAFPIASYKALALGTCTFFLYLKLENVKLNQS